MALSVSYLSATLFVLILSTWKCFSNIILLVSYTKQTNTTVFRLYALNIVCLTINALFQGLFGIVAAVVGLLATTDGIGTYTCSAPMILFFSCITDESWQTLYVFIQQCLAFRQRRIKPNPHQIVLVNIGLLLGSLISLGIPLQVWTRNDASSQRLKTCTTAVYVNSTTVLGYFACLTGLPGCISVLLYLCLQMYVRRRSKEMIPLQPVGPSGNVIRYVEENTLNTSVSVMTEANNEPRTRTSNELIATFTTFTSQILVPRSVTFGNALPGASTTSGPSTSKCTIDTTAKLHSAHSSHKKNVSAMEADACHMKLTKTLDGKRQPGHRRFFTAQARALKTMAMFLLVNTSLTIQFFFVWLVSYVWPQLPGIGYSISFSFALLYFNTSLNIFVIVKRYTVISEPVLDMLRACKDLVVCRSCHRRA